MSPTEHAAIPIMMDWRLFPAALTTWACTWWAVSRSWGWTHSLLILGLFIVAAASTHSLRSTPRVGGRHQLTPAGSIRSALLALAAAGLAALAVGGLARASFQSCEANEAATRGALITLNGRVDADPKSSHGSFGARKEQVNITILSVGKEELPSPPVRLMLRIPGGHELYRGDIVRVRGLIDPTFPGALPYAGSMSTTPVLLERPGGYVGITRRFRLHLERAVEGLDDQGRALVPGMAIGNDRAMSEELEEAFRASSLSHLTAVSGSHMAIVLSSVPLLLPRSRRARILGALTVLVLLVMVVGPTPAVMRAAVTSTAGILGQALSRGGQGLAALSLTVLVIVLLDPWAVRDFGFALSVCATFAVVVPAAACRRWGKKHLKVESRVGRFFNRLFELVCVSAWCQIMTIPILLLLDPALPVYSLAANIAAAPAVAPATLLSLSAALAAPFSLQAGQTLALLASYATAWIAKVALVFSSLPGARSEPKDLIGVVLIALVLGVGVVIFRSFRVRARNAWGTCDT
ncbi:ComEC/Rec2 family competence protein [Schaalia cardiffensis]|uniref:ComEC/Rec2 family competence protein n=1 Tax=Schaalia cardiffensis TaxID=181487 RepID=UPI002AB067CC|nr:ComEC/Rec2 family competence protein [Schaalia cardiffensis]